MKLVVRVKLLPDAGQASGLAATLCVSNKAASWLSRRVFESGVRSRKALQPLAYAEVKAEFGLSAQPALHVIRKTADAYTTLHANIRAGNLGPEGSQRRAKAESKPIAFRPDAAQPFDDRCLSWNHDEQTVSIWTVAGRMKGLRFVGGADQLAILREHRKGETDLVRVDGQWYLVATCEIPAQLLNADPRGWLGVDLGIVNVATTNDGTRSAGRGLNRHRRHMLELRAKLQAKKTKSAKRALKRVRRRESRHVRDVNHRISKQIVAAAQRTGRGIALEDLTGIRDRARLRKPQRATLHSWAFAQLGQFIAYKAEQAGVPVVFVDPRNTSRRCASCGHVDKRNRTSQARFSCRSCGHTANADHNASRNIADLGDRAWNAGRESRAPTAA